MRILSLFLMVFILGVSTVSHAAFYVNYFSEYGIYGANGTDGILSEEGDTALIQLLYAGDNNQIDEITDYDLSTGDDIVIGSFSYNHTGYSYEEFVAGTYGTVVSPYLGNGYIYGRVFSDLLPTIGTSYYVGALVQAPDIDVDEIPPLLPSNYNLGGGLDNQTASSILDFETNNVTIISLSVSNDVGGAVSPSGTTVFYGPTSVTLEATPDLGYIFSTWVEEDSSDSYAVNNPLQLTVSDNTSLVATFGPDLSDGDNDGLSLYDEVIVYGSDPTLSDSSGDGLLDGVLVLMGLSPTDNFSNIVNTVQQTPQAFGVYGAAYVEQQQDTITALNTLVQSQSNELQELTDLSEAFRLENIAYQSTIAFLEDDVASLTSENNQLTSNVNILSAQAEGLNNQVNSLIAQNDELSSSVSTLTSERDTLNSQVTTLEASQSQLLSSNQDLQQSVDTLTSDNESLLAQVTTLQSSNNQLEEQLALLSSSNDDGYLAEQITILQATNNFLNAVVQELIDENLGLEETNQLTVALLEESLSENVNLVDRVTNLELEIIDLETELENALEDVYVDNDYPYWNWNDSWHYSWHKPNYYWWGWGNPPARKLPKWGRDLMLGKKMKMKRIKKRWNKNNQESTELEVEVSVEETTDLANGEWVTSTNSVNIDIPVDDNALKFYRVIYN